MKKKQFGFFKFDLAQTVVNCLVVGTAVSYVVMVFAFSKAGT